MTDSDKRKSLAPTVRTPDNPVLDGAKTNIWGDEEISDSPAPEVPENTHPNYKSLEYFGNNKIKLGLEVRRHPELQALLVNHNVAEFEVMLAEIAAYCHIGLNDTYTPDDIEKLCGILVERLTSKRTGMSFSSKIHPDDLDPDLPKGVH